MELCSYPCPNQTRHYEIEAIQIPIVYNKYGDHDPDGLLYVLKKDASRIKEGALRNFNLEVPQPYEEVMPLVIRANVGEKIVITFSHSLKRPLSIHVQGLAYDVQTSDGASVGYNKDSTTRHQITYTWYAVQEGVYLFHDMGDTRSSEEGTNVHGLFGAIIVEAPESRWLNPQTGEPLESGMFADIYHPTRPAFREYAVFFHDELEMKDKDGNQPIDPHTGLPSSTTAISYRSEPMRNRMPLGHDHSDTGEDISMSSWVYGDPAPPILRAYVGDPSKIRLIHGGIKETHVFHLHNHQWRLEGDNQNSTIIDSISISPQECYTLDILHGAGSLNGTIGDVIFHCHLYPHFHEGMWTLWRIHDRLEDGTGKLPDGTPIPPLLPLADRISPPKKEKLHPGYPNFIKGTFGEPPLQPPLGILNADGSNKIAPTPLEQANFVKNFAPGALYSDTCPCQTDCNLIVFEIALVQAKVTYNRYGWHDPQGRFFVLKSELERHGGLDAYIQKVENRKICVEPLVIRANAGDCVEIVAPGIERFRECVVIGQNGIRMLDKNDVLIQTAAGAEGDTVDAEDTGEKGYNYRSERFANRLKRHSQIAKVFNSRIHGDPATPVFKAYAGDRVIFRTVMPADKPRNTGFCIHGHTWKKQPDDPYSHTIPLQGAISIGNTYNMELQNGAAEPGDYLYRSGSLKWDVESGMWGIFRVLKQGIGCTCRNICKKAISCVCKTK